MKKEMVGGIVAVVVILGLISMFGFWTLVGAAVIFAIYKSVINGG